MGLRPDDYKRALPVCGSGTPPRTALPAVRSSPTVEPLNATMLAAANADYDAGASLAEIAAYEGKRFEAADLNKDGWVTEDEQRQGVQPRR